MLDSKEMFKQINRVNCLLASCEDIDCVAAIAINHLCTLAFASVCIFAYYNEILQEFNLYSSHELGNQLQPETLTDLVSITNLREVGEPLHLRSNELPVQSEAYLTMKKMGIAQILLANVTSKNRLHGYLLLGYVDSQTHVNDYEKTISSFVASQTAAALENAVLISNLKKQNEQFEAIYQSSLKANAFLHLKDVMASVLDSVLSIFTLAENAQIFLYDGEKISFETARWREPKPKDIASIPHKKELVFLVAQTGQPVSVKNIKTHPLFADSKSGKEQGVVGIPLKSKNVVVGVMYLEYSFPYEVTTNEMRLLRLLGDHAAVAIENARLHQLIESQALTDVITGIPNRRSFETRLNEEILRSSRYNHSFGLIAIDIDNFKKINDTYGHPAGDKFLFEFAKCLQAEVRDTDFVARTGGDEFAIILPESNLENAKQLTNRLENMIATCDYQLPDTKVSNHTASFGIAVFPDQADNADKLLKFADQALYIFKRQKDTEEKRTAMK